jgi:hypothetical protein
MAQPPAPLPLPLLGYFERGAAMAAAKVSARTSSSTYLALASTYTPTITSPISFADTISDVTPSILITLDLPSHSYYHLRQIFDVQLGRCNLRDHLQSPH